MSKDFCHLHVHTEYSVLDGMNKISKLCAHVKKSGMSSCAITDHGNLHGLVEFYKSAKENGINPVIGVEAYLTNDADDLENPQKHRDNHHCILLAKNNTGLKNLIWLINQANLHNFYFKPRISFANLASRSEGLIATSSCLGGIVGKLGKFSEDGSTFIDDGAASQSLSRYKELFGSNFYAEIQDHGESKEQIAYNKWLVKEAQKQKIPLVITADAHFLTEEDYETHKLMMAQQLKKTLKEYNSDEDGLTYFQGHCIRTIGSMHQASILLGAEEAFYNTTVIANQCKIDMKLGSYSSPNFEVSKMPDYEDFKQWRAQKYECGRQA
jgi:DNA polymerase-3 subunit alpha